MFNRFDVCDAWYLFASLYHTGMGSREYQIFTRLSRIRYQAGAMLSVETLDTNAREIFDGLVARAGMQPYPSDRRIGEDHA